MAPTCDHHDEEPLNTSKGSCLRQGPLSEEYYSENQGSLHGKKNRV